MRGYLSHSAMILLGVTLTVGFYEGRRLVKNTARALGASPTVAATGGRRGDEELRARLAEAEDALAARRGSKAERSEERPRRRGRGAPGTPTMVKRDLDGAALTRDDRLQVVRERRLRPVDGAPAARVRPIVGGAEAPAVTPEEPAAPAAELVDTGVPPNP